MEFWPLIWLVGYAFGLFSGPELDILRGEAEGMFDHAWDHYFDIAFPDDELRPLTCIGVCRNDSDPGDTVKNDVLGGYSLTLIDSLDMFAMMNRTADFHRYIDYTVSYVSFNVPSTVQVFETTIRAMGGLISSHLYASLPSLGQVKPEYDGELLKLAYDLGERLLPAFDTATGIPHPRINLQEGIVPVGDRYITDTCSSGAGSLLLEFTMLSRLTGDPRFEEVARRAFFEIWARRSDLDLVAMSIDSETGQWLSPITGVGASIDSYFEYALKYYVLFGDEQFYSIFDRMHQSLQSYAFDGWMYNNINFQTGVGMTSWVDSLAAFYPGLQVLAGNVEEAIRNHLAYYKLWVAYGGIPERWNLVRANKGVTKNLAKKAIYPMSQLDPIDLEWYPLRPEFIESNYYLYRATQDPFYLQVGRMVMQDLEDNCKTECGYAGIHDVRDGQLQDRMETFFLSETTKYLYLLYSPDHPLNKEFSNFVFSTEAHPFWYDSYVVQHASVSNYPDLANRVSHNLTPTTAQHHDEQQQQPQSLISRLWAAWEGRLKAQRPTVTRYYRRQTNAEHEHKTNTQPSCHAWKLKRGLISLVASWDQFYTLDSFYNYQVPPWLDPNRKGAELEEEFYHKYVVNWSQCRALALDSILELVFPTGEPKASFQIQDDTIEASSFTGSKLKLARTDFNGINNAFKVLRINDLNVGEKTIHVHSLHVNNDDPSSDISIQNNTLLIHGDQVVNVKINTL